LVAVERLLTADGLRLEARSVPGESGTAVVVTHGFASHQDHEDVLALAEALHADGHTVLTYDGRGHGRSEGACTLGDLEALDVAAAAAAAREDADRVVLVGASMGAIAVLRHAAGDPDLAGVVAVSSPAAWEVPRTPRAALAALVTRTRPGRWFIRRQLGVRVDPTWSHPEPPLSLVERVTAPLAFVHGRLDKFIRPSCSERLHAAPGAGPDRRRLELVEGMDHAYHSACVPAVRSAVAWALGISPAFVHNTAL
jgi:pimeloyl-ACP methyl ester carboxylesterase